MTPAGTNPKIEELRAKVKHDPKSRLFYPLAEELRKAGQWAEAESVLRAGLTTHSTYLSAWVVLGRVLREQQKHGEAVDALTRALDLDRGNVVAARLLAESYLALGDKVEAIKKYKLVHALLPGDDEIEATIHRLETELKTAPAEPIQLSEPPAEEPEQQPTPALAAPESQADVFDTTYSRLKKEAKLEIETGDAEPMSAAHAQSPFEEPAGDAGYSADAMEVEAPRGIHLAATPMEADLPSPFPPPPLPPETSPAASSEATDDADVFEPADEIAPGFIQGAFSANVAPPPVDEEVFARTLTMADLYASQGLVDEARDIYEDILARDPSNAVVLAKLGALERSAPASAAPAESEDEDATLELRSGASYTAAQPAPQQPAEAPAALDEPVFDAEPEKPVAPAQRASEAVPAATPQPPPKVEKLQSWLAKVKRPGAGGV